MTQPSQPPTRLDLPIILGIVLLLLFASPLTNWWSRLDLPWYTPYVLWALLIVLVFWLSHKERPHEP